MSAPTPDDELAEAVETLKSLDRTTFLCPRDSMALTTVLAALAEARKPDLRWCPEDAECSTEDLEEELDNASYDKGMHIVEVACAKRLPKEFYIWDTDYEREEPNKLTGPFPTEAEAKAAIAAAAQAKGETS